MLRSAAFASSVVASIPIVFPLTSYAVASTCTIHVNTARWVSTAINRRVRESVEWRCCMNTRYGWGGVARTSRDPPQEPHYGDEVEGSSQV